MIYTYIVKEKNGLGHILQGISLHYKLSELNFEKSCFKIYLESTPYFGRTDFLKKIKFDQKFKITFDPPKISRNSIEVYDVEGISSAGTSLCFDTQYYEIAKNGKLLEIYPEVDNIVIHASLNPSDIHGGYFRDSFKLLPDLNLPNYPYQTLHFRHGKGEYLHGRIDATFGIEMQNSRIDNLFEEYFKEIDLNLPVIVCSDNLDLELDWTNKLNSKNIQAISSTSLINENLESESKILFMESKYFSSGIRDKIWRRDLFSFLILAHSEHIICSKSYFTVSAHHWNNNKITTLNNLW